jgi:hypothetical protein
MTGPIANSANEYSEEFHAASATRGEGYSRIASVREDTHRSKWALSRCRKKNTKILRLE